MPTVGFHCSHEQVAPSRLLADVQHAEAAGFAAAMCSDHLAPWTTRQGESGHAWAWLGAALATTELSFGVVTAPGQRYHPAVVAQAIATLGEMFPGRFWAALGSGEAVNEHVTGEGWPRKELRDRRLVEVVDVIRRLLSGDEVSHEGLVTVDRARIWSRPQAPPALVAAAVGPETAARAARWADGLITVNQPGRAARRTLRAYRDHGGGGLARLQVHLSWAPTRDRAMAVAMDQWSGNVYGAPVSWDTDSVEAFDVLAKHASPRDIEEAVHVSEDLGEHADRIAEAFEDEFDEVYLHFVGKEQGAFIDAFGEHVLPRFADPAPEPDGSTMSRAG